MSLRFFSFFLGFHKYIWIVSFTVIELCIHTLRKVSSFHVTHICADLPYQNTNFSAVFGWLSMLVCTKHSQYWLVFCCFTEYCTHWCSEHSCSYASIAMRLVGFVATVSQITKKFVRNSVGGDCTLVSQLHFKIALDWLIGIDTQPWAG